MDSEHRHELQENDLAEFLANFGSWWKKHGNTTIIVVLIISAYIAGKRWYDHSKAQAHEAAWSELAIQSSPESYELFAKGQSDPVIRALAYLRAADQMLSLAAQTPEEPTDKDQTDPLTPKDTPDQNNTDDALNGTAPDLTREQVLDRAASLYQKVVEQVEVHPVYRFNALLGLAAVAEGAGQWPEATRYYNLLLEEAGSGYESIASQARVKLAMLDQITTPIEFAPDPTPPTAETQPAANKDATDNLTQPLATPIIEPGLSPSHDLDAGVGSTDSPDEAAVVSEEDQATPQDDPPQTEGLDADSD